MKLHQRLFMAGGVLLLAIRLAGGMAAVQADEEPKKAEKEQRFLRVLRGDDGEPLALQTSVTRYVSTDPKQAGLVVDLIGAIHIADRAYFDELNKLFDDYEVLLYELVAPADARIPKEGRNSGNPVSGMQKGMQSMLGLEFQLERIDYTKKNFVHADMSPEEFAKSMADRGESFLQIFFRMMGQGMAEQSEGRSNDLDLLRALFSKDRPFRMKRIMAEQFENMEGSLAVLEGPDGSTLISLRNKKAFEVLDQQIKAGKKRIGVFYGAGHLPDMEQRLTDEFNMKREGEKWVTAWSLAREQK